MNAPNLSVIIPVFNGINYTQKCLHKLFDLKTKLGNPGEHITIVVVDDGSTDGTTQWIMQNYPSVHLIQGDGSLWWSGGINKGVHYALKTLNSDYILWWNNDVFPREDYFEKLFSIIENHHEDVIIGSKIYVLDNDLVWGMGGKFDPVNGTRYMYGERQKDNPALQKPVEVDWFPGMGTTIHRSVFDTIGFLDEVNFPQYYGDSDFTLRAKAAGFRLIAFPDLVASNDNTNTGIKHNGSYKMLYRSLTGIKSIYGVQKDFRFLRTHARSYKAYAPFVKKYFNYIGGFLKWKVLNSVGVKKELQ